MPNEELENSGVTDENITGETGASGTQEGDQQTQEAAGQNEPPKEEEGKQNAGETILGKKAEESAEIDFKSIVPEGMVYDETQAQAFAEVAKKAGLNNEQMSQMAAYGMKYMQNSVEAVEAARIQQIKGWVNDARTELGNDFDTTIATCGKGIEALEKKIPNLRAALNETGAGNRIEIIRAMAYVGQLVSEDSFRGFGNNSAESTNIYTKTNFDAYK